MAYDEELAARVRPHVQGHLGDGIDGTERAMFGGLAFLVDQHMAVAVSGQGGLASWVELGIARVRELPPKG